MMRYKIVETEAQRDIVDDVPRFLHVWFGTNNNSTKRSYSKALCLAIRQGLELDKATIEQVAERALDLLIAPNTPIASRAWALYILQEIDQRVLWVERELPEIVRQISQAPDCSPGMAVATRRYLHQKQ